MSSRLRVVAFVGVTITLFGSQLCATPKSSPAPSAPVPSLILSAKKIFVANAGGDEAVFDAQYSGGPDRLYDEFYAAVKSWGRYELTSSPGNADLVFEIGLTVVRPQRSHPLGGDDNPAYDSQLHIAIRDVKTQVILWGLTEHAESAILQGNRDKNFEQALTAIMSELRKIAGPATPAAQVPAN